jgi:hypothetical protein
MKAMKHALLDAYDRADETSFGRTVESSFVLLDDRRIGGIFGLPVVSEGPTGHFFKRHGR